MSICPSLRFKIIWLKNSPLKSQDWKLDWGIPNICRTRYTPSFSLCQTICIWNQGNRWFSSFQRPNFSLFGQVLPKIYTRMWSDNRSILPKRSSQSQSKRFVYLKKSNILGKRIWWITLRQSEDLDRDNFTDLLCRSQPYHLLLNYLFFLRWLFLIISSKDKILALNANSCWIITRVKMTNSTTIFTLNNLWICRRKCNTKLLIWLEREIKNYVITKDNFQ